MNIIRNLPIGIIFITLAAGITGAQTRGTYYTLYGLNFIGGAQTMRVNLQNLRHSDSEIIPCIRVTVMLDFYDPGADGSVRLQSLRRVTRQIELDPGDAASFEIPATLACDGFCPAARNGVYVATSIFATPDDEGRVRFNSTAQIREGGRSIFTLPIVEKGFDPQPDPPR